MPPRLRPKGTGSLGTSLRKGRRGREVGEGRGVRAEDVAAHGGPVDADEVQERGADPVGLAAEAGPEEEAADTNERQEETILIAEQERNVMQIHQQELLQQD